MENLTELFSIPVGLKLVTKVSGVRLYTSESLLTSYVKAIHDIPITRGVWNDMVRLVGDSKITPCYLNKGILQVLKWKLFVSSPAKNIVAFFSLTENKVFIIIDNNINLAGYVSNEFISRLTLHECSHMAAHNKSSEYFKLFLKELIDFYTFYFGALFKSSSISEKNVSKFVEFIIDSEKGRDKIDEKITVSKLRKILLNFRSSFEGLDEQFNIIVEKYLRLVTLMLSAWTNETFNEMLTKLKSIISPFYRAYQGVFGLDTKGMLHCQEVIFPSEVISIYIEKAGQEKLGSMISMI